MRLSNIVIAILIVLVGIQSLIIISLYNRNTAYRQKSNVIIAESATIIDILRSYVIGAKSSLDSSDYKSSGKQLDEAIKIFEDREFKNSVTKSTMANQSLHQSP